MNYANLEEAFAFYNSSNLDEELEIVPSVLSSQEIPSISKEVMETTTGTGTVAAVCNCCSDKSPYDISNLIIILLLVIIFFKK
jgi:hypothetical protein